MHHDVMRLNYRPLTDQEKKDMQAIKGLGLSFYDLLNRSESSRELELAKVKVEEAVMWATKHITG